MSIKSLEKSLFLKGIPADLMANIERSVQNAAMGVTDLSLYPGRRRLKKRFAKKFLAAYAFGNMTPNVQLRGKPLLGPAIKTFRRPQNRRARAAWKALTEAERISRLNQARWGMATVPVASVAGLLYKTLLTRKK